MSESEQPAAKSKAPTHIAYHIRKSGKKPYWDRIGSAWEHADGKGYSVKLDLIPLNSEGYLTLRTASEPK